MSFTFNLIALYSTPFLLLLIPLTNNWNWLFLPVIISLIGFGYDLLTTYISNRYWLQPFTQRSSIKVKQIRSDI